MNSSEDEVEGIYKVFSTEPLDSDTFHQLFTPKSNIVMVKKWDAAYPRFSPPEQLPPFRIAKGHNVYYLNALESAVSAMEISAIAGRNIALLIERDFDQYKQQENI